MIRGHHPESYHELCLPPRPLNSEYVTVPTPPFHLVRGQEHCWQVQFPAAVQHQAEAVRLIQEFCGGRAERHCPLREFVSIDGTVDGQAVRILVAPLTVEGERDIRDIAVVLSKRLSTFPQLAGKIFSDEGVCCGLAYHAPLTTPLVGRPDIAAREQELRALLRCAADCGLRCWNVRPDSFGIGRDGSLCLRIPETFMPVESCGRPQIERDLARALERLRW